MSKNTVWVVSHVIREEASSFPEVFLSFEAARKRYHQLVIDNNELPYGELTLGLPKLKIEDITGTHEFRGAYNCYFLDEVDLKE